MEKLTVRAGAHLIHDGRLEILRILFYGRCAILAGGMDAKGLARVVVVVWELEALAGVQWAILS